METKLKTPLTITQLLISIILTFKHEKNLSSLIELKKLKIKIPCYNLVQCFEADHFEINNLYSIIHFQLDRE